MSFVKFGDQLFNLDHIKVIRRHNADDPNACWVKLSYSDGTDERLDGEDAYDAFENAENLKAPVVQADAG